MKRLALLAILIFVQHLAVSQTISELEQRREKTEQEIAFTTELLTKTEKERIQTVNQLNLLKGQITLRKRLIGDLQAQIKLYEKEIGDRGLLISSLSQELENQKREYAKLIRFSWLNKSDMNILMFILASNDFNQAYRRMRFYQQYLNFRKVQAEEIMNTQKIIEKEILELSKTRSQLASTIESKNNEVNTLNNEENRYSRSVRQLQNREAQLRKEIEERRKAMEALNKAISDLIAEEARKAAEAKRDRVRDARYIRLSDGFSGNKGKLPWPSNPGVIVGEFGEHEHPVLKGVKIRNNGIDISTTPGAIVRSIYEGEVKKIVSIPGANVAVLIRHGDYLSVYSNLVKVHVKVGDNVNTMQPIGECYTDPSTGKGIFNLQIWQESKILNPGAWILP